MRLALERPAVRALTEARVARARSEVTSAGRWPNPEVEYSREELDRPPGDSTEEALWLSQRFELSGARALRRGAAERRVQAATLGTAAERVEIAADARARFHRVLHQQERVDAIEAWTRRLAATEAVIRKREAAGEVSGYDTLRLSTEQLSAEASLTRERAAYRRRWAELAALLGGSVDTYRGVVGRLLPEPPPALASLVDAAAGRPDIARLAREAEASDLERRAGERGWIPDLTLGVGRKTVDDELGTDSGPMIAAGITVPLFDRGQAEEQRAAADAAIARGEHRLAVAAAAGEIRGLWHEVTALTGAAWERRQRAREQAGRLVALAEIAYRGGEIGILELLDAYRGAHDAELEALETAATARQARIELDRLTGEIDP